MATPPVSFNSLAVEIITEIWTSLPRKSKSDILSVSRAWNTHARSIPYMWTDILFGEGSSMNDLTVAHKWLVHSGNLNLTVIILRPAGEKVSNGLIVDAILEVLAPARDRLQHLQIHAADTDVNFVQTFMMTGTFSALKFVDITLHRHWLSIIRDEPIPASTLAVHPVVFHALNFPRLSAMRLSHIPPFWPSLLPTCDHLTQIVLGPHVEGFEPSLTELKHALESATSLTHLGFYRAMPLIDESALAANFSMILSALTSLSLRHVQPVSLRRIMAILTIPSFSSLTIALDEGQLTPDADGENDINLLVEQLHAPEFAHRLRTLNIQTFHYQCDIAFFQPFTNLRALGLDFSYGGLTEEFCSCPGVIERPYTAKSSSAGETFPDPRTL
ncbi:hypothetical protein C8R43DRAFT_1160357 [Mycena crocata]|nr:hypothetical protein C8R43DRAFT_1160357 [Mycena crocata]